MRRLPQMGQPVLCLIFRRVPIAAVIPLADIYARDCAVHDFKTYLKRVQHRKPTSVNLALADLDHFYQFLSLSRPAVRCEPLLQQAPRGLDPTSSSASCGFSNRAQARGIVRLRGLATIPACLGHVTILQH